MDDGGLREDFVDDGDETSTFSSVEGRVVL